MTYSITVFDAYLDNIQCEINCSNHVKCKFKQHKLTLTFDQTIPNNSQIIEITCLILNKNDIDYLSYIKLHINHAHPSVILHDQ